MESYGADMLSLSHSLAKSRTDDLEILGQGQKSL